MTLARRRVPVSIVAMVCALCCLGVSCGLVERDATATGGGAGIGGNAGVAEAGGGLGNGGASGAGGAAGAAASSAGYGGADGAVDGGGPDCGPSDVEPMPNTIVSCCAGVWCQGQCLNGQCSCYGKMGGCAPYHCCSAYQGGSGSITAQVRAVEA